MNQNKNCCFNILLLSYECRVLSELYFYCEIESNSDECTEVLNVLHKSAFQFYQLNQQLALLAKANAKNTRSIAWNVSALSSTRKQTLKNDENLPPDEQGSCNKDRLDSESSNSVAGVMSNNCTNSPSNPTAKCWGAMRKETELTENEGTYLQRSPKKYVLLNLYLLFHSCKRSNFGSCTSASR